MTLRYFLMVPLLLAGMTAYAQCPTPNVIQAVEFQREAQLFITNTVGADSIRVSLGDEFFRPGSTVPDTVITFPNTGVYLLFGLEPGRRYKAVAQSVCGENVSVFGREQGWRQAADGPPENDDPNNARIYGSAIIACIPTPQTTFNATAGGTASACDAAAADDDVWFSLRATSLSFRVEATAVGGTDTDLVLEIADAAGNHLACVDEAGPGEREVYTLTGLGDREDYLIRIYTAGTDGYAIFTTCGYRVGQAVAEATGCVEVPPVVFDGTGAAEEFVDVLDSAGALVVSLANNENLGEVNVSYYDAGDEVRTDTDRNARYAGRNISIVPENQPAGPVAVRLYLSAAELTELIRVTGFTGIDNLDVTKIPAGTCSNLYPGGGSVTDVTGFGELPAGQGFYVDVTVESFSEFFFHPAGEPLGTPTSVLTPHAREDYRYTISPNPVDNIIRLSDESGNSAYILEYQLVSVDGRLLRQGRLNGPEIEVGQLQPGLYALVLRGASGLSTVRFLKR